ncbi:MAG TPA: hypothetical protein VK149_10865, partial [Sideroxyarcus sp.]|nr:hypothetical protein [Sideroxyarcus sp.]
PLLPISNRTVKRLRANDSVHPHVKVGHRQTPYKQNAPPKNGAFCFDAVNSQQRERVTAPASRVLISDMLRKSVQGKSS